MKPPSGDWQWRWSIASAHCGVAAAEARLELELWTKRWTAEEWSRYLAAGESAAQTIALRQFTHTGRPLGTAAFVAELEQSTLRPLAPRKRGRRRRPVASSNQQQLVVVA